MLMMIWNEYLHGWDMLDEHGFEMYMFRNCGNINRLYKHLDKTKINWYDQKPLEQVKQKDHTVSLCWNVYLNGWEMIDIHGFEMYVFRNCTNINRLYVDLQKDKINYYAQTSLEPFK